MYNLLISALTTDIENDFSSVYHFGYILWIGLYLGGLLIKDQRKARRNKRSDIRTVTSENIDNVASEIEKEFTMGSTAKIKTDFRQSNLSNDFNKIQ